MRSSQRKKVSFKLIIPSHSFSVRLITFCIFSFFFSSMLVRSLVSFLPSRCHPLSASLSEWHKQIVWPSIVFVACSRRYPVSTLHACWFLASPSSSNSCDFSNYRLSQRSATGTTTGLANSSGQNIGQRRCRVSRELYPLQLWGNIAS